MKTRSLILHSFLLGLCACSTGALENDLGVPPGRVDAAAPEDAAVVDAEVPDLSGCALPPPGAPAKDSYPFMLNGQLAWSHDEGSPAGYFHTYDALKVGGPEDPPHKVHVLLPQSLAPHAGDWRLFIWRRDVQKSSDARAACRLPFGLGLIRCSAECTAVDR